MADLYERIKERELEKQREIERAEEEKNSLLMYSSVLASHKMRRERQKKYPLLSRGGGLIGLIMRLVKKNEDKNEES